MSIIKNITTRKIIIAEAVLVLAVLLYIFFSANNFSAPIAGKTIFDPDFVFEIGEGEELWISASPEFTNPIIVREETELDLKPGIYYWKIKNLIGESEVKTFTIEENINLDFEFERQNNQDLEEKKGGITSEIK